MAEQKWREIIQRQGASGLSVARFCRNNSVPESSLFAWKRRMGRSAAAAGAFIEAKVTPAQRAQTQAADSSTPWTTSLIEVRLRGGRIIRLRRGFDPVLLAAVIHALEGLA
jgi:hypothetical protein